MKQLRVMPLTVFRRLPVQEMREALPLIITADGSELMVVGAKEDVMIIGDMNPYAQRRFRAIENQVRAGMPKAEPISIVES